MTAVVIADFVNRENVWMVEIRCCGSFLVKPMQSIFVSRVLMTQDLDCNLASELHVFRKIDHAHPARAELLENSVMGNFLRIHVPFCGSESLHRSASEQRPRDRLLEQEKNYESHNRRDIDPSERWNDPSQRAEQRFSDVDQKPHDAIRVTQPAPGENNANADQ